MKTFLIVPSDVLVAEENIDKILCKCFGKLKITATEETLYGTRLSHELTCEKCGGKYSAIEQKGW